MRIIAITQARLGSSRLPGKVLKKIEGQSLLQLHLYRALQSKLVTQVVVATTDEPGVEQIAAIASDMHVEVYHGSLEDVLDRYYQAAKAYQADVVVRITSDCPLIDPQLIDDVIEFALQQGTDYCSNTLIPSFPDGQDIEVFSFEALQKAWQNAVLKSDREHVTPYIWKNSTHHQKDLFTSTCYVNEANDGDVRLTIDEAKDLETVSRIVNALGTGAGWKEYAVYYRTHTTEMGNADISRNEGYFNSLSTESH